LPPVVLDEPRLANAVQCLDMSKTEAIAKDSPRASQAVDLQ